MKIQVSLNKLKSKLKAFLRPRRRLSNKVFSQGYYDDTWSKKARLHIELIVGLQNIISVVLVLQIWNIED